MENKIDSGQPSFEVDLPWKSMSISWICRGKHLRGNAVETKIVEMPLISLHSVDLPISTDQFRPRQAESGNRLFHDSARGFAVET